MNNLHIFIAFIAHFVLNECAPAAKPTMSLRISHPLNTNYTRKNGERLRLECNFELQPSDLQYSPSDLTIYWVKNYQELLQNKKGQIHIIRKNLTTILILRNLDSFDSGSYMCIAELSSAQTGALLLNASSETTLFVNDPTEQRQDHDDYLLSDIPIDDDESLVDDFPELNPTIMESSDDKGFCEAYKGTVCAGIITANYSIYSTSAQQQELIEERLNAIIPLLSNKNNLSQRCAAFAIPSLCLFAFPLCDHQTRQPKQICRSDCKQLQLDICKNEYVNVKALFSSNMANQEKKINNFNQNFLLDCNQLPPSSDSSSDCLPIIKMTQQAELQSKLKQHVDNTVMIKQSNEAIKPAQCLAASNGADYRGTQSYTRNGFACQRWDQVPNFNLLTPDLVGHNHCRNFDNNVEPWCFTNDPQQPRDYCNIPKCTLIESWYLSNLMAICIPSAVILLFCVLLIVLYCRCCRKNNQDKLKSVSMQSQPMLVTASINSNGLVSSHIQPNRLRMSNTSIGKNKNKSNNFKAGSSKSSVASSANHQLIKINEHLNSYNSNQQFQHVPQIVPQAPSQTDYTIQNVSPNNIRLLQEIGKGRFGSVYSGELLGFGSVTKVTVKTLKPSFNNVRKGFQDDPIAQTVTSTPNVNMQSNDAASHFTEQEFYNEISLYSSIRHRNLANLVAVFTTNHSKHEEDDDDTVSQPELFHPQCMMFEHLNNGDLHEYLMQRANAVNGNSAGVYNGMIGGSQSNLSGISSSIGGVSTNYLTQQQQQRNVADFLYIGQQIAAGMEYLAAQNFILKDLATRNILMSDNLTIKISVDLVAQYKECYARDYYKFQMKMLPVRWMPPESLLYGRHNQQSDVWSFGVCLWEIFSYGAQPYAGCTNPEAIEMIRDRQLLALPEECPQRAYALMLECWHEMPMQRPTFTEILNRLRNWENYYLFNNGNQAQQTNQLMMPPPPPLPLPLHLQQTQQQTVAFGMTSSYSSNSQNSKASSLLGNTASTGISSGSPPPLPPPLHHHHAQQSLVTTYSPSKMNQFNNAVNGVSTNLFMSKFNGAIAGNPTNSLRMSQRNFNIAAFNMNMNNNNSNCNNIPNGNNQNNGNIDGFNNHHFDL